MPTTGVDVEVLRSSARDLCSGFPNKYWQEVDEKQAYPKAFVDALTQAGYLAALIPEQYGDAGLGIMEASVILEEINRSGRGTPPPATSVLKELGYSTTEIEQFRVQRAI